MFWEDKKVTHSFQQLENSHLFIINYTISMLRKGSCIPHILKYLLLILSHYILKFPCILKTVRSSCSWRQPWKESSFQVGKGVECNLPWGTRSGTLANHHNHYNGPLTQFIPLDRNFIHSAKGFPDSTRTYFLYCRRTNCFYIIS